VARRTFEIGVRKALGATASDVLRGVLRRAATLVAVGLAIGALTAFWLTRYLGGVLFAVAPTDRPTFAVVACTFVAVALLASYLPARRAGRVDPMKTLRGM
jgi:ABC-type antimicrobial peptide transport system permease subunit